MNPHLGVVVEPAWHRVPGGTQRAAARTLAALVELDRFRITGIAARHAEPRDVGVEVLHHRLPRPVLYEAWHHLGRPALVGGPHDVIWSPATVVPPRSAPLVVTVHDLEFLHHPEFLSRRGRRFHPTAFAVAAERADRIVVPSEAVAADCRRAGVGTDRLRVVPWGAPEPWVVGAEHLAEARLRLGVPDRFVLWVGTLEPRKNLSRLVEAMAGVDAALVVVGPPGWEVDGRDVLAPLGARAIRLGFVDDTDLRTLYAAATVFALPSLAEGFGLPVLEAMAAGTAVVTSQGTATEEVAGDAARLIDPLDAEGLSVALDELLTDDAERLRLEAAGLSRAASLSWTATGQGYADVFEELLR